LKWQEGQYPAIKANLQEAGSAATEEDSAAGEEEWRQCSNIQDQAIINLVKLNIRMQECNNNPGHQGPDQASTMCNVTGARAGDMCPSTAHPILQFSTEVEVEHEVKEAREEEDHREAVEISQQLMPPWSRPDQELLHRRHRCRKLPQLPRHQGRETSCAPLWPAWYAGGEVGSPCPP